jgi:hypothetical protein
MNVCQENFNKLLNQALTYPKFTIVKLCKALEQLACCQVLIEQDNSGKYQIILKTSCKCMEAQEEKYDVACKILYGVGGYFPYLAPKI